MIAVSAKTPANEFVVVNAAKTSPVAASDSAPPRESEMDMAALLKPWFSSVESANVMTESRGYMSPMPPPARIQPAMATAAGRANAAVTKVEITAISTRESADLHCEIVRQPGTEPPLDG